MPHRWIARRSRGPAGAMPTVLALICIGQAVMAADRLSRAGLPSPVLIVAGNETVIASVVATEPPFSADRTGATDASRAIQRAIGAVAKATGGVVYLPPGRYRIDHPLKLAFGVTLSGQPALGHDSASATLLLAYPGRGDESAPPLIELPGESGLMDLTIAYPEQRAERITPYPFTIVGGVCTIRRITLCNSYNGLLIPKTNGCMIESINGTALKRGLVAPFSTEFAWMHDVRFGNDVWRKHAATFAGRPLSDPEVAALGQFTRNTLTGLELGRLDALAIQRFSATDAALPVRIKKNAEQRAHRVFGFGGVVAEFPARREDVDPWYYGMHFANLDNVPEAHGKTYRFAPTPTAARLGQEDLHVVTAAPFQAVGDGKTDDTRAIQAALNHAGQRGGGIVYLPPGEYRISAPLRVPAGVELRGALGRGFIRQFRETCTLAIYTGCEAEEADTAPAAVTLGANAGIRGLSLVYPEQGLNADTLKPYPWTIRGAGPGAWAIDLMLLNSWNGIDLATNRCDRHLVRGIWGTAFRCGIMVGGGSQGGRLEHIAWSYGPLVEAGRTRPRIRPEDKESIKAEYAANARNYVFGACRGERAWGLVGFLPQVHIQFRDDGVAGSCRDAEFWLCMFDVALDAVIQADQGQDIRFYSVFATGGKLEPAAANNWVELAPGFRGPLTIHAPTVQPIFFHHPLKAGPEKLQIHGEVSLVTGRKAISGPDPAAGKNPEGAIDRDIRTFWQAPVDSWLQVDLGEIRTIGRFGFDSAWARVGKESYVQTCELHVSTDGVTFRTAGTLATHGSACADMPLATPMAARFVRLVVKAGGSADKLARIAEFRVAAENQ
ncbi:MAG: hypothetical protein HN904_29815 [Victivallales bacterium]|nr:hypothetical protein [Victivallales bacterium]